LVIESFGKFEARDIRRCKAREKVPGGLEPEDSREEFKTDSRKDQDKIEETEKWCVPF
jgi:hypothetical protein